MQWKTYRGKLALVVSLALVGLMSGCGGGGGTSVSSLQPGSGSSNTGGSTTTTTTAGIALPQEVSAISADNGTATVQTMGLRAKLMAVAAAAGQLPADSDYKTEAASKYVDEPALQVFSIIDTILKAVAQTHYADPANVGAGPYKTMVGWYDTNNGQKVKQVETWIVDSKMDNGTNIVDIWPDGDNMPSAVEAKIEQAPTQTADGSYSDYGKWTISATFNASGSAYFEASADIDANGMTVLTINEVDQESGSNGPLTATTKAIVHKANGSGYGQALVPNWDVCQQSSTACQDGQVPGMEVKYAYNQDYLTYQKLDPATGSPVGAQVYKDRGNKVEMDYQYGLFDATTGADVQKAKSFGFPVNYTDANGTHQAYYGAWQGLHQLWSNDGSSVPDGTTVTRAGIPPNQTAPTYTVKSFPGSLTKRTLAASDISQLHNIPVQAWISRNLTLIYDGTASVWDECSNVNWSTNPVTCNDATPTDFTSQLNTLEADPTGQKAVNIDSWDQNGNQVMYAYNGSSFDIVDGSGNVTGSYTPAAGDVLNVNIGGNIYIEYTGDFTNDPSGWVQKTLTAFDQSTNTPTFGSTDQPFDFANGAQYELNNNGANFVVERVAANGAAADYTTSMEVQTVANPTNAATVVPTGTVFKQPWDTSAGATTYSFDTDPTSATYLTLVYDTVSAQDKQAGHKAGDVLTDGGWGLFAYDQNGTQLTDGSGNALQYNWQYANGSNAYGSATYLVKSDGTYKLLDDPVMLQPVQLTTNGGDTLTFSLQYDGWLHGLPDMHQELEKNNYQITKTIADKVVNIPDGTLVSDEAGHDYFIKPMEIGVILPVVTASDITTAGKTAPDLSAADQADLGTVPAFVDPNVAAAPTNTTLKYIEGQPVQ